MKVAQIKSAPQFESRDWRQYGIQTYGDTNDFPQTVSEIVQASKTGNACLSIYNDFVYGHGFKDPGIYKLRVNKEGEKLDKILRMVCKDFTLWHGFAIHVNYNMNFRVSSIHHIPFESLRLAKADDDGFIGRTAYHPDWGHRDKTRSRWSPSDIEWFHLFNRIRRSFSTRWKRLAAGTTTMARSSTSPGTRKAAPLTQSPYSSLR